METWLRIKYFYRGRIGHDISAMTVRSEMSIASVFLANAAHGDVVSASVKNGIRD